MLPPSFDSPSAYITNKTEEAPPFFAHQKNKDFYWEALLQIAKNHKKRAEDLVASARSSHPTIATFPWKEDHPPNIDAFFDKFFLTSIHRDPLTLTYLGLFESIGVNDHNSFLTDISPKALQRDFEEQKNLRKTLLSYSLESLSPRQTLSYKIFLHHLNQLLQEEEFLFHEYFINQMFGTIQTLTTTFLALHPLKTKEDIDHFILRLNKIPEYFRQAIETAEYQKEKGILPPRFALEKTLDILKNFTQSSPEKNIFYLHLLTSLEKMGSKEQKENAKEVMEKSVYPAYEMLKNYLKELLSLTTTHHGVWALPHGDHYYTQRLRHHTTTELTSDEIHELGKKEVKRIQEEIRALLASEGIQNPNCEVGKLLEELSKENRFYYPDTEVGRQECLQDFETILERCRQELWPLFDLTPKTKVLVKAVPKHEEGGCAGAYYLSSSIDGTRPGTFYVNLRNMKELPQYQMETLAIHEAEPGHHFQISIENDQEIPIWQKINHSTAFVEGWALYAEKLAYEEGFYSSSFSKIGHLQMELLRAARLVVDTGIHAKHWSREEAIRYMKTTTGDKESSIVAEVERYFVMPGQACAYKIGQMKILELRQRAKTRLGDGFDLREFHNVLLKTGSLPLTLLEEVVEEYITKKSATKK